MNAPAPPPIGRPRRDRDLTGLDRLRWAVRAVLMLGVAASVAANVLHARSNLISQLIAAWPPLALMLTVELISRVPADRRALAAARLISAAIIAGIAAWVSYWHMVGVAARYGETSAHANYLLPLSVDGLVVVASISLVEIAGSVARKHRTPYPAGVSANAADAIATQPATADAIDDPRNRSTTAMNGAADGVTLALRGPHLGCILDPHHQPSTLNEDSNDHRHLSDDTDNRDGAEATPNAGRAAPRSPADGDDQTAASRCGPPDADDTSVPARHGHGSTSTSQDAHPQPRPAESESDLPAVAATAPTHGGQDRAQPAVGTTYPEITNAPDQRSPAAAGIEAVADAEPLNEEDQAVPTETPAAVAYWYRRDSAMHPADIAAKIGRSERTVRRYWPPRPVQVNGERSHDLAEQIPRP